MKLTEILFLQFQPDVGPDGDNQSSKSLSGGFVSTTKESDGKSELPSTQEIFCESRKFGNFGGK